MLQNLDRASQVLEHLGKVLGADDRIAAAQAVVMQDLRERLLRSGDLLDQLRLSRRRIAAASYASPSPGRPAWQCGRAMRRTRRQADTAMRRVAIVYRLAAAVERDAVPVSAASCTASAHCTGSRCAARSSAGSGSDPPAASASPRRRRRSGSCVADLDPAAIGIERIARDIGDDLELA